MEKPEKLEIMIPADKLEYLQKELTNIRPDFTDDKYIAEAQRVLAAGGLRSAIGSYWNAVVHDLRSKVIRRSLDLFNKEMKLKHEIKTYEDFQKHVTDHDLIDGAYKIGVIDWEGHKLLHHAKETRHIFDGHPDSTDPTLFKVFNMIADCNRYVLSKEPASAIINTNEYITAMDSPKFHKNELAVAQAFSDLPPIYKSEMINKFFALYIKDSTTTTLRANIEFCAPILWDVLPKSDRQQMGERFDKCALAGIRDEFDLAITFVGLCDGMKYVSSATRKIIFEPAIKNLESALDDWAREGDALDELVQIGTVIPAEFLDSYVTALTLTYVGYGSQYYSWAASPKVISLFRRFDSSSIEAFIRTVKTNEELRNRITYTTKLQRLRNLASTLLTDAAPKDGAKEFLELIMDDSKTSVFFASLVRPGRS